MDLSPLSLQRLSDILQLFPVVADNATEGQTGGRLLFKVIDESAPFLMGMALGWIKIESYHVPEYRLEILVVRNPEDARDVRLDGVGSPQALYSWPWCP